MGPQRFIGKRRLSLISHLGCLTSFSLPMNPSEGPSGFGVRQSSGALAWIGRTGRKRQRTGALHDAGARTPVHGGMRELLAGRGPG